MRAATPQRSPHPGTVRLRPTTPTTLTCEVCLKALDGDACSRHPHADAAWLAVLRQRRTIKRIKRARIVGLLAGFIALCTLSTGWIIWLGMVLQFIVVGMALGREPIHPQTLDIVEEFTPPERSDTELRMRRIARYDRRISRSNRSNQSARSNLALGLH